jgi:hypothetical protein
MNSLRLSLIKYFSLLSALVFTAGNIIMGTPDQKLLFILQLVFGGIYILFSVLEFVRQLGKTTMPSDRFFYFPLNFLSRKFIKLGAFTIACVVLFISKSSLVFLGGLVLIVIIADVLVFLLRISKKMYYISLFSDHVLLSLEHEKLVFASQVEIIEFRYGIFYLKLKNGNTFPIEVSRIDKAHQNSFTDKFVLWVVCNKLHFTDEAKEKLADIIAEAI